MPLDLKIIENPNGALRIIAPGFDLTFIFLASIFPALDTFGPFSPLNNLSWFSSQRTILRNALSSTITVAVINEFPAAATTCSGWLVPRLA